MSNPTPDTGTLPGTALETYGWLLSGDVGRDAIHLAVYAVTTDERLFPGQHVGISAFGDDGIKVSAKAEKLIGIVDPFLEQGVFPGDWFWLTLYPRTITSLRHEWTHPAFDVTVTATPAVLNPKVLAEAEARAWIERFADELDQTFNKLMAAARQWEETSPHSQWGGEYTYDNSETYKGFPEERWADFWRYYEVLKGSPLDEGVKRESFFTCSC